MPTPATYPADLTTLYRRMARSARSKAKSLLPRSRTARRCRAELASLMADLAEMFEERAWA